MILIGFYRLPTLHFAQFSMLLPCYTQTQRRIKYQHCSLATYFMFVLMYSTFYSYSKCYFLKSILPIFSVLLCNFILFKRKYTRYRRITTSNTHAHIYRKQCSSQPDELCELTHGELFSLLLLACALYFSIYFQLILFHSTLHRLPHKML